ncbi:hypothetical protein GCM10007862_06660 [Dyella lipolytica]|uniref:DUF748 domain-containing protein n=1 Tax=Dyella lipolytica TaxID=1867835 RepID=A0ABW8IYH9_9GAMM|nr:DUF748 domain-containing protein [Dyella lipolytica]GLQ45615.1 hypothetical protein GCM10007862_06660 [Dyella lipolytica]
MFRLFSRLLCCLCTLSSLLWVAPSWADTVIVAKRVDLPGVSLQEMRVQLVPGADPDTVRVSLHAGKADIPVLGWRRVGLTLDGTLKRDVQMRWLFDGAVQIDGAPGGALGNAMLDLVVDASANTLEIDANQGPTHIGTAFPLDQPTHVQVNLRNLPAGWLQGVLGTVWAGHIASGKLDADLALDGRDEGFQSSGDFTVADLKYATPAGNPAGQGLAGHGRFAFDATSHPAQLTLNGGLRGGELQLGPVLARLPAHDVELDLSANVEHGALDISRLRMDDADALQLEGALSIDAKGNLQKVKLDHFQARFPAAYDRYGQPWLDSAAAPNLHLAGQLEGHLDYVDDTWRSFALRTDGLDVADSSGQLQANGLHGAVDWSAQADKSPTTLAWNQLVLRRFAVGAAQSHWRSRNGSLGLQSPLDIPILKGQAQITALEWRPAATKAPRLNLAATIAGVDMATLNQTLGWMPFAGTLGGSISSMQWTGDRYALEGQLTIKAFDGTAVLTHMSVQRPLSDTPIVATDIALHQLDLAPLSDTFNFGNISGRLDGSIDGLQLVATSPIAFKASLLAQNGGRISLHAANNLSIVTGGSAASGLQGAVLKLFKTFNYKRMGINTSLQGGVCTLSGLDGDTSGYTIVESSGLPSLHVVGEQTRIDWPVLIHRLKAASQGTVAER